MIQNPDPGNSSGSQPEVQTPDLQAQLRCARAELASAHQALRFLSGLSHELRTPLAGIEGFLTTLLVDDLSWSPQQEREFLQIAARQVHNLSRLTFEMNQNRAQALALAVTAGPVRAIGGRMSPADHSQPWRWFQIELAGAEARPKAP